MQRIISIYLIHFVTIKNTITQVVEVYRMVWKERLDAGDGIKGNIDVAVICGSDKDELGWRFMVSEIVKRKSIKPRQFCRIFVQ